MKRLFLLCLVLSVSMAVSFAQWLPQGTTKGNIYYNAGNIGIGTSTPVEIIQIGESNSGANNQGKIKISGVYSFEQVLLGQFGNGACGLEFVNHSSASECYSVRLYSDVDQFKGLQFQIAEGKDSYQKFNYQTKMSIRYNGNVGIGTSTPDHKLDVVGTIRAHEILVETKKTADFVFDKDYQLPTLQKVEEYVIAYGHLPDIAPADSMIQNGLNMGEFQIQLLKKIEELTLYTIEQQKEITELKKQNKQFSELKQQVDSILNKLELTK